MIKFELKMWIQSRNKIILFKDLIEAQTFFNIIENL